MVTKQIASAWLILGLLASTGAGAFAIAPNVPVEFDFNTWDASTVSYSVTTPFPVAGTALCTSGTACDTLAGQPGGAGSAPNAAMIAGLGYEDDWGVGNIQAITSTATGDTLWQTSVGERLTAMFYGIVDNVVTFDGFDTSSNQKFAVRALGGYVDLYIRPGAGVNLNGGPGARTGLDSYPTATDGTLFLRMAFGAGVIYGDSTHTFQNSFSTGTVAGQGSGYLDVIGGAYADVFNTNAIMDPNGGRHDFSFDLTVNAQGVPAAWTVRGQGQAVGETPIPGTLLLLGAGLAVLGGLRRPTVVT